MLTAFAGEVIAAYGRHALVRDAAGKVHEARPRGRKRLFVCGDAVRCTHDATHGEVLIDELLPRRTALYRTNSRGDAEPVVANISLLFVMCAPIPAPEFFVMDRYLAAAASGGVNAMIVLNKVEQAISPELRAELDAYVAIGYAVIRCSAKSGAGTETVTAELRGNTGVFVGQSGVGKSSLVQRLVPGTELATAELDRGDEGRHTTTAARLYELPDGGRIVDSPGVRDFAPAIERLEPTSLGFLEIARIGAGCRFRDCKHLTEPGCAVRESAEQGALHPRRYESYRRLRRLHEKLTDSRQTGRGR